MQRKLLATLAFFFTLLVLRPAAAGGSLGKSEYETASRFFDAEEFEAALPYFERAYTLSDHRPPTILGLAQCLRALKRYPEAIARYREYLATHPAQAGEVEETLHLLEALAAHAEQQAAERAAQAAEVERRAREAEVRSAEQRAEEERARVRAEAARVAEDAARRVAAEEASRRLVAAPALPPANPPAVAADERGFLGSPLFWVLTGVLVASGGATAAIMAGQSTAEPYAGSTGVLLIPRR